MILPSGLGEGWAKKPDGMGYALVVTALCWRVGTLDWVHRLYRHTARVSAFNFDRLGGES